MTEIFTLLIVYFHQYTFFVRIKQTSKNRSLEAAIQMCFKGKKLKSRENPSKTTLKEFFFW